MLARTRACHGPTFVRSVMRPVNKSLLSSYNVLGPMLGARDTRLPSLPGAGSLVRGVGRCTSRVPTPALLSNKHALHG